MAEGATLLLLPVIAEVPLGAGEDFRWSPSVGANLQSLASLLEWLRGRRANGSSSIMHERIARPGENE